MCSKEERKILNRQYRETHKEYFKEYHAWYGKKYRELKKKNCVYKIMDKQGNIIYIGSSVQFETRYSNHITGNTHLRLDLNWDKYNISHFEVTYVDNSFNRCELFYLEDAYIKANENILNENSAYNECNRAYRNAKDNAELEVISGDRKKELDQVARELKFEVYK